MATAPPSNTVIDHTSDAGFRAWVAELIDLLGTGGALVQTADTGQINTATATRPGSGASGGYANFRFDDALQATAPFFFRFEFRTGGAATWPTVWVTVGTGTNGAGTLTGSVMTAAEVFWREGITSTVTAYPSYACGHPGIINIAFKVGASPTGNGLGFLSISRSRDVSGSQTGEGVVVVYTNNNASEQRELLMRSVRGSTTQYGTSRAFALAPMLLSTSAPIAGTPRYFRWFTSIPDARPMLECVSTVNSEVARSATFTARPLGGGTDRTYLALGTIAQGCVAGHATGNTTHGPCMLYD